MKAAIVDKFGEKSQIIIESIDKNDFEDWSKIILNDMSQMKGM